MSDNDTYNYDDDGFDNYLDHEDIPVNASVQYEGQEEEKVEEYQEDSIIEREAFEIMKKRAEDAEEERNDAEDDDAFERSPGDPENPKGGGRE